MTQIWNIEDKIEDALSGIIAAQNIAGLSLCKTYDSVLPENPYCAVLALRSKKYMPDVVYGQAENRVVMVSIMVSGHAQDMTRAEYAELVGKVFDSVYIDEIVSTLNTALAGEVIVQEFDTGDLSRGISKHSYQTTLDVEINCYPTTADEDDE